MAILPPTMSLPAPVLPMAETALIDEAAAALGQDLGRLMEAAGAALAAEAMAMAPTGLVLVATGPGNNGGDGWVAARLLAQQGRQVAVWPVLPAASALCQAAAHTAGDSVRIVTRPPPGCALAIDAILGAGANGPLRPPVAAAVVTLNALKVPILSADIPTGLGGPDLVAATRTLCFQTAKAELLAEPRLTEFKTVDIGIDPRAYLEVQRPCLRRFPLLHADAHKGKHGQVVIIGGGRYPGALELSCRAAYITGVDLVHAWTSEGPPLPTSIVAHRQPGPTVAPSDPDALTAVLLRAGAVLIGPGLGRQPGGPEAAQQAFSLAQEMGVPMVIDADGISSLVKELRDLPPGEIPVVVTPHRTEARSLLGEEPTDDAVHAYARPDRVVLRKGKVDLISNGLRWQRNPRGNPRMTVGGTGDCLAGLTAGLLARGASPYDAARIAVYLLTTTADRIWPEAGPCYGPEDILARFPAVLREELTPLGMWPPVAG